MVLRVKRQLIEIYRSHFVCELDEVRIYQERKEMERINFAKRFLMPLNHLQRTIF